jgi:hypothetical protein
MRTTNHALPALAVCGILFGGCAEQSASDEHEPFSEEEQVQGGESGLVAGCTALGTTMNSHTCQHGLLGPFKNETASSNPNFAAADPKIEAIHEYTTVTLPSVGGGNYAGTVKFTPVSSDDHAIYVKPSLTISVRDKNGAAVSSLLTNTIAGCSYLTSYKVFYLSASLAPFKIDLAATTSSIKLLLEEVSPFAEYWYKDVDLDTWGNPSTQFQTPCVPPAGWTVKRGLDCNDSNAAIKPGAVETPNDGIDSNCNGQDNT